MKRCPYCGKEYSDEASTCAIDGHRLAVFPPQPNPPSPRDDEKMVTIEIFASHEAAEIAASKLEAYGIARWLKADDAGGMYPNLTMAEGVRLQVRASDAEAATALLTAQLSSSEISELEARAVAAPPLQEIATARFAPVQIFFGIGLGIFLCLLCQQIEKPGTRTDNYYGVNGKIYEQWVYRNGHLLEIKKDRNLDGKWDEWTYYSGGWAFRSEFDNNFDGKPDEWWTYSYGGTDTLQKDTDFNGVPDEFWTYEDQIAQEMDMRPNDSKFITMREIFTNGVLSEIWRGGDSNGVFKKIERLDPFLNTTNTQFGEFRYTNN